jgi:light-regulated signal transduction histidine kinase (bacteriophytochrome)
VTRDKQPFEDVNLRFVLHQVLSDLELTIEETGAQIHAGELPVIKGSLTQMKQLFANILNNAIKFRKPGTSPEINISSAILTQEEKDLHDLLASKQYHKITISDNGIGFAGEYAERIFQIFQRLHGKSDYPGSGIGLAICKKIVDHHHGLIFAKGSEGAGAEFVIILPVIIS